MEPKEKIKHKQTAWAVKCTWKPDKYLPNCPERTFLVGRYYFMTTPKPEHDGCRLALFDTRAKARKKIKEYKESRNDKDVFIPVKVEIQIKEL